MRILDRPHHVIAVTNCQLAALVELSVELQIQTVFDVTAAIGIGKDDLVISVLGIGLPCFVPIIGWAFIVCITDSGFFCRRHLVRTY